jgi:hypothetical protein
MLQAFELHDRDYLPFMLVVPSLVSDCAEKQCETSGICISSSKPAFRECCSSHFHIHRRFSSAKDRMVCTSRTSVMSPTDVPRIDQESGGCTSSL